MTDSEENTVKKGRVRLRIDPKERFPEKLYDVVNDGHLIHWNVNGDEIYVSEEEYEQKVMTMYPGFVQISQFPNLRRLFREYGFDWRIKVTNGVEIFQFAHPSFVHGRRHLLSDIRTRRKSYTGKIKFFSDIQDELTADECDSPGKPRYKTRSKYKKRARQSMNSSTNMDLSFTDEVEYHGSNSDKILLDEDSNMTTVDGPDPNEVDLSLADSVPQTSTNSRQSALYKHIMSLFIKNEFTFDDFCTWIKLNQTNMNDYIDSNVNCNQGSFDKSDSASRLSPCHQCACCLFYNTRYEVLNKPCVVVVLDSDEEEID